jgi:hypothetical protein
VIPIKPGQLCCQGGPGCGRRFVVEGHRMSRGQGAVTFRIRPE